MGDGFRMLPKIIRRVQQLTWWGETKEGYTIFRDENTVGGHRYWSDEIGGGVIVWDTSLVSPETLRAVLMLEEEASAVEPVKYEDIKMVKGYRADIYESLDRTPGDGDIPVTISISDALASISTPTLHKEIIAREIEAGALVANGYSYEEYANLYEYLSEDGGVNGEFFGHSLADDKMAKSAAIIMSALRLARDHQLSLAHLIHARRLCDQCHEDLRGIEEAAREKINKLIADVYGISNDRLYHELVALRKELVDEVEEVREDIAHVCEPLIGDSVALPRYERDILLRKLSEAEDRVRALEHANRGLGERLATGELPKLSHNEVAKVAREERDPDVLRAALAATEKRLSEREAVLSALLRERAEGPKLGDGEAPRPFLAD